VRLGESAAARYGLERDALEGCSAKRYLALTYTIVGRRAEAVAVLQRVRGVPACPTPADLRLDPTFDGLRGQPGFEQLLTSER
jgi:hypothetical protein